MTSRERESEWEYRSPRKEAPELLVAVSPGAAEVKRRRNHGEWERKPQTKEASFFLL